MSVFSVNQATHLYVVPTTSDYAVGKDSDGNLFFKVKDADGKPLRSDLLTNIVSIKAVAAADMRRTKNAVKITTSATPVVGQQYFLVINYQGWINLSDEITYQEFADFKATTAVASDLYKGLALSLAKNTAKQGLVDVYLYTGAAEVLVTATTAAASLTGSYTELRIVEKEQPWILGIKADQPVEIKPDDIICSWGTVTKYAPTTKVGNGKRVADLEWFCLGERGDQYREVGYPYINPTKGQVNPSLEYDMLTIHYSYIGSGISQQKSEKDLIIVAPTSAENKVLDDIIGAINTATGASEGDANYIATLDD